ncbi:uncharacterized protein AMSG_11650 [Thecamonas trahens ATCC 50062]|uniref:Uncharacterized protein n=1 Tax=Thecamonas trahens ATCC 50062 TaxID=461836 RepID=A0A0L0DRI7_THETB|nr:hypothetical protein AMSG_11650 [Thecamonas trahens ATCC 50062]KNC54606.1 hypothetical protein AMSG_11650 [Thecamonas trahens ATCC 50062]|eukprot:XP_013761760.1 hypothetical protein AMSG_11650 [Thecamonas trahens ATCC 50062]
MWRLEEYKAHGSIGWSFVFVRWGTLEVVDDLHRSACIVLGAVIEASYLSQMLFTFLLSLNLFVQVRLSLAPGLSPAQVFATAASSVSSRSGAPRPRSPVLVELCYLFYGLVLPFGYVGCLLWRAPYRTSPLGWCAPTSRLYIGIPLLVHFVATALLLAAVLVSLRTGIKSAGMFAEKGRRVELKALRRFSMFLVPVLVTMMPVVVLSVFRTSHHCLPFALVFFLNIAFPAQAFLNAIVFGINKDLRRALSHSCCPPREETRVAEYPSLLGMGVSPTPSPIVFPSSRAHR